MKIKENVYMVTTKMISCSVRTLLHVPFYMISGLFYFVLLNTAISFLNPFKGNSSRVAWRHHVMGINIAVLLAALYDDQLACGHPRVLKVSELSLSYLWLINLLECFSIGVASHLKPNLSFLLFVFCP